MGGQNGKPRFAGYGGFEIMNQGLLDCGIQAAIIGLFPLYATTDQFFYFEPI